MIVFPPTVDEANGLHGEEKQENLNTVVQRNQSMQEPNCPQLTCQINTQLQKKK